MIEHEFQRVLNRPAKQFSTQTNFSNIFRVGNEPVTKIPQYSFNSHFLVGEDICMTLSKRLNARIPNEKWDTISLHFIVAAFRKAE